MRKDERERYPTEADLCAAFIPWAKRQGWTAYAETEGWDILLAHADGTQIGVQAKLRFNLKLISQTLPERWDAWRDKGPDFRAVLLPAADGYERVVCGALGLMLVYDQGWDRGFAPDLLRGAHWDGGWHYWNPKKRHELPAYIPDVAAGASGPSQLTQWKVKAMRIAALLELRGYVTKEDFKHNDIDSRRWTGPDGWLQANGTPGQYKASERSTYILDLSVQHPKVYPQIRAEVAEQLKKLGPDLGQQRSLAV